MSRLDGYTFIFDIDGTLCPIKEKDAEYRKLIPYADMVEKLRRYREEGARIVLFSSRNMNTYHGDLDLIRANTVPVLHEWLARWRIPYDELVMGKPWPGHKGFYVDDRTVRPDEFLALSVEEMEKRCEDGRGRLV